MTTQARKSASWVLKGGSKALSARKAVVLQSRQSGVHLEREGPIEASISCYFSTEEEHDDVSIPSPLCNSFQRIHPSASVVLWSGLHLGSMQDGHPMFIRPVGLMGDQERLKAVKCSAGRTKLTGDRHMVRSHHRAKAYQRVLSKSKGATKADLRVKRIELLW
ncbi:hypothetical protein NDA14_005665 [Ustilago hordei]|nr:hypothetical protein NDA14_005665 [Ustilago hordei]